ncbi:hypothetical protein BD414DRAFT_493575 [Trametes punicea]|nr:hypothetical protein BD414DRAFT_493575 [Trametes punicea]
MPSLSACRYNTHTHTHTLIRHWGFRLLAQPAKLQDAMRTAPGAQQHPEQTSPGPELERTCRGPSRDRALYRCRLREKQYNARPRCHRHHGGRLLRSSSVKRMRNRRSLTSLVVRLLAVLSITPVWRPPVAHGGHSMHVVRQATRAQYSSTFCTSLDPPNAERPRSYLRRLASQILPLMGGGSVVLML